MVAHKKPIWLLIIFCFLIVYCGVHLNLSEQDWLKVFEKTGSDQGREFLYVATGNGIYAFRIDKTSGAFSLLNNGPYNETATFTALGAPRNGKVLLASYASSSKYIYIYPINADGTLAAYGSNPMSNPAQAISVDPIGRFAAICYMSDVNLYAYNIDYNLNKLVPVPTGAPYGCGDPNAPNNPLTSAFTPDGQRLYAGINLLPQVKYFQVDPTTGSLSNPNDALNGSAGVTHILFHPFGKYVYIGDKSTIPAKIHRYTLLGDGTFSQEGFCQLGSPSTPLGALAIDPAGRYLFAAAYGANDTLYSIPIDVNGALSQSNMKIVGAVSFVRKLAVDPSGYFLYMAASYDGAKDYVKVFGINSDGSLQDLSPYTFSLGTASFPTVSAFDMVIITKY
ncbi:MAG TPA: hypothetical protein VHP38_00205 [Ruminiclostridium sp.]|nr:hypothetical protein [Ruminiclostridium sp.]